MRRTLRTFAFFVSGSVLLFFVVFVVNQTNQVVQLASSVNPALGTATLTGLIVLYTGLVGVPIVMIVRLPKPLKPPKTAQGPEFDAHLVALGARLTANPLLAGRTHGGREQIEASLEILARRTDAIVKETAAGVFLATAVSQSGRLDGLLVLLAQSRMMWRLAHVYAQRPGLAEVMHLYANVAGTVFLATELQDVDLAEQVEPILSSTLGSIGASNIPGMKVVGAMLANCILSGSANAFLTLRVGMIAKRYCSALVVEPKPALRRHATAEAARMLGGIVAEGSGRITKAFWTGAAGKVADAWTGTTDLAKGTTAKLLAKVGLGRREPGVS